MIHFILHKAKLKFIGRRRFIYCFCIHLSKQSLNYFLFQYFINMKRENSRKDIQRVCLVQQYSIVQQIDLSVTNSVWSWSKKSHLHFLYCTVLCTVNCVRKKTSVLFHPDFEHIVDNVSDLSKLCDTQNNNTF